MKRALLNCIFLSLSLWFPLRLTSDPVILVRAALDGGASELIAAVNDVRNANGVGLLRIDEALMVAAQRHSEYQASICQGTHTEPGRSQVRDRALAAGYGNGNDFVVRENVDAGPHSPEEAVQNWVLSPGHFQTMIYPEDTDIGVGVAWGCGWSFYTLNVGHVLRGVPLPTENTYPEGSIGSPPALSGIDCITHVVQPGESPWSIAQMYGITDNQVLDWNNLSPGDPIHPGQQLLIPITPTATLAVTPTVTTVVQEFAMTMTARTETTTLRPSETPVPSATPLPISSVEGTSSPWMIPVIFLLLTSIILVVILFLRNRVK